MDVQEKELMSGGAMDLFVSSFAALLYPHSLFQVFTHMHVHCFPEYCMHVSTLPQAPIMLEILCLFCA